MSYFIMYFVSDDKNKGDQSLSLTRVMSVQKGKVRGQRLRSHGSKKICPNLGISEPKLEFELTDGYKMIHKAWSGFEEVSYCFMRSSTKFQGDTGRNIVDLDQIWVTLLGLLFILMKSKFSLQFFQYGCLRIMTWNGIFSLSQPWFFNPLQVY